MTPDRLFQLRAWWFHAKLRLKARTVVRAGVLLRGAPVIAVTGTNGKTTTVHLIDRLLRAGGYKVGTCTTYGVYHNGNLVAKGDRAGHRGVWRALHCPGLQVLVAETARGGMLKYGTGFARCRVGVVTNVHADHLGMEGVHSLAEMGTVKSEIVRRTQASGAVVLNADDERVRAMASLSRAPVGWFSVAGRESEFEHGWFLRDGWLCRKQGAQIDRLLRADEMPVTLGGHQVHNVANALAALAAVEAMSDRFPVPRDAQLAVLRNYERDHREYPTGRYILTRYLGQHILFVHCKNPEAYRLEAPMILRIKNALGCRYLVGVASGSGNRREDHHRAISERLAGFNDHVFLRPSKPRMLRGMPPAELLRRLSLALKPGQLLSTEPLGPAEMIALCRERLGDSFLLAYYVAMIDPVLNLPEFLQNAEIVSLPAAAVAPAEPPGIPTGRLEGTNPLC